jgi:hypothetical protein
MNICNKANVQYIVVNLYIAAGGRVRNFAANLCVLSLRNFCGVLISAFRDGLQRNWFSVVDHRLSTSASIIHFQMSEKPSQGKAFCCPHYCVGNWCVFVAI